MLLYLKSLIQLILAPRFGWEDVENDGLQADRIFVRGFIPLAAIAGLMSFVQLFYHPSLNLVGLAIITVIEFMSYFLSYYIGLLVLSSILPSLTYGETDRDKIRLFTVESLGLLCFVGIIRNCLPSDLATVNFLLIYIAIIMWRAIDYLRVELKSELKFTLISLLSIMLPSILIQMLSGNVKF